MWVIGQRVVAELEPELGLGIVVQLLGGRQVEVAFPGAQVRRRYAQQTAPLRRFQLAKGHRAKSKDGANHVVAEVQEIKGLLLYLSEEGIKVWEYDLAHVVEDDTPVSQFLMGNWSLPKNFDLRERAWALRSQSMKPQLRGLVGARLALLPHQLSIAADVSHREFPRVLLADEVGLGKTIEAGLIFSSLRALGRAGRVLILVPEALQHQWLAEMYRRFNEIFTVVDQERSDAEQSSQGQSIFKMNQRIICSFTFFEENPDRLEEATAEKWDLLIVDEAHKLVWSEDKPSESWQLARALCEKARGLLLLTATPERQGVETQFGLLHLVDPHRFYDFDAFKKQSKKMHDVAQAASKVQKEDRDPKFITSLKEQFSKDKDIKEAVAEYAKGGPPEILLAKLVDRHGTGRVFIRNRRSRLGGFPERKFHGLPLKASEEWLKWLGTQVDGAKDDEILFALASGQLPRLKGMPISSWFEPRAAALKTLIDSLPNEKVLLICSDENRVLQLQDWFRRNSSIRTAIFHEDMEIVERDRQAAWFGEENGARVLLCSEIGGEGRNFQFCRNLFLFDVPTHPDALEQRIGRLDRIGQAFEIRTFVPFYRDTPEEAWLQWFAEGMESFVRPWNGGELGPEIGKEVRATLRSFFPGTSTYGKRMEKLGKLIQGTRERAEKIRTQQRESIDLLVDINSFDEMKGKGLAGHIQEIDESPALPRFMEDAFDHFGIDSEIMDQVGTVKLNAHSMTFVENFPGLSSVGEVMATYHRGVALQREELSFLSWEHPIVQGAMTLVLEGNVGKITAGLVSGKIGNQPIAVELLYVLQCTAPAYLEVEHDLPVQVIRMLVALDGTEMKARLGNFFPFPKEKMNQLVPLLRTKVPALVEKASAAVTAKAQLEIEKAMELRQNRFAEEHARLSHLAKVNPLISDIELKSLYERCRDGLIHIKATSPRLDAIRLVMSDNL